MHAKQLDCSAANALVFVSLQSSFAQSSVMEFLAFEFLKRGRDVLAIPVVPQFPNLLQVALVVIGQVAPAAKSLAEMRPRRFLASNASGTIL
jgi:hypothetical protein